MGIYIAGLRASQKTHDLELDGITLNYYSLLLLNFLLKTNNFSLEI